MVVIAEVRLELVVRVVEATEVRLALVVLALLTLVAVEAAAILLVAEVAVQVLFM